MIHGHINTGSNFYDYADNLFGKENLPDFDCIVSNPPFSNKAKLIGQIISFGKPFALLLPITWLNDSAPSQLFKNIDLELLMFNRRIQFINKGKQPSFGTGYFCHGVLPKQIIFEDI